MTSLREYFATFEQQAPRKEKAITALEDYSALLDSDSVPAEFDFGKRVATLKAVIGKGPGSFKTRATIPVSALPDMRIVSSLALIRGVHLNLSWDMKLVSVTIDPKRYRERKKLMAFVGIGRDTASDVARRHDEYLAAINPHGNTS